MALQRTAKFVRWERLKAAQKGSLFLPVFLLALLTLGTRLWSMGSESSGKRVANTAIAGRAQNFCRKIIGSPGEILEMFPPNPLTKTPFWTVRCATNRGDYSLRVTPDGETLTVASELQVVTNPPAGASAPHPESAFLSESAARDRASDMTLFLGQSPERILCKHIRWQGVGFWEMYCRCLRRDNAVRTYRIQVDERTGRLQYLNLKIDRY